MSGKDARRGIRRILRDYAVQDGVRVIFGGQGNPNEHPRLDEVTKPIMTELESAGLHPHITLQWPLAGGLGRLIRNTKRINMLMITLHDPVKRAVIRHLRKRRALPEEGPGREKAVRDEFERRLLLARKAAIKNGFALGFNFIGPNADWYWELVENLFREAPPGRPDLQFSGFEKLRSPSGERGSYLRKTIEGGTVLMDCDGTPRHRHSE
jgi:hypothetical protein